MSKQILRFYKIYSKVLFSNKLVKYYLSLFPGKKISLIFSLFFICSQSIMAFLPDEKWSLYKEINGVKIYTSKEDCHDFVNGTHYEYIVLKFENSTPVSKKISWSEHLYYNGICNGCEGKSDRPLYEIELKANETVQGGCGTDQGDTYRIFSRFLNYTDKPMLTKYELVNLNIIDR